VGVIKKLCCLSLFSCLLVSSALASTIQATFTGVNGENAFGYYIGAYYGQLESQNVSLYCDDFANEVNFGQKWMANLSTITTGSDLSQTRYGDVKESARLYKEIAWLDTQFGQQPTDQWADIHATIWQIFDPSQAPKPSSSQWLEQAQRNYNKLDYSNYRVVTNVAPVEKTGQVQEFLTILPPGSPLITRGGDLATPEPGTAFLMGAGILFAALVLKRTHAKKALRS